MVTIAPRTIKQRTASHTVLITANPRMVRICELIVSVGLNQALKGQPGTKLMTSSKSFAPELTSGSNGFSRRFGVSAWRSKPVRPGPTSVPARAVKKALLSAGAVAYSTGASGVYAGPSTQARRSRSLVAISSVFQPNLKNAFEIWSIE